MRAPATRRTGPTAAASPANNKIIILTGPGNRLSASATFARIPNIGSRYKLISSPIEIASDSIEPLKSSSPPREPLIMVSAILAAAPSHSFNSSVSVLIAPEPLCRAASIAGPALSPNIAITSAVVMPRDIITSSICVKSCVAGFTSPIVRPYLAKISTVFCVGLISSVIAPLSAVPARSP